MAESTSLYHYCSTQAFHSIVSSRSIRLSSLSLSNDTLEGKLVAQALARLAKKDRLKDEAVERLLKMFSDTEAVFDGLGFCLSEDGDLLSQWRGYASDATGVSIGFSREYLEWLSAQPPSAADKTFALRQVQYEPERHDKEVEPTYARVRRFIKAGAFETYARGLLDVRSKEELEASQLKSAQLWSSLASSLYGLFPKLFLLKSRAFREEREWRLLSNVVYVLGDETDFFPGTDRLVPYRRISLLQGSIHNPIREVVLGPKHLTPCHVVANFLNTSGFSNVLVRRSDASYR